MPKGGLTISIGDAKCRHCWRDGVGTSIAIEEGLDSIEAIIALQASGK